MASSATVGSAVIKLSFDGKNVKNELTSVGNDVESKAGDMGSRISSAMKKVAAGIATAFTGASAAVVGLVKGGVESYAEYEQLVGGAELMFGDAYSYIAGKATDAYKTVQLSANEYLKQVNGFATGLKTSLGGNEQAAAELADRIVTAEADIVAATGNSQENIQNAFNGIMKSNFTMLDNLQLGIKPTKEGFQEVIDKVNEWNAANGHATSYVIDNLADCQSALVDYVEMQGLAGYATNEASKTIQGSVASMKAAWENYRTELVNGVHEEAFPQLLESVQNVAKNLIPVVKGALTGVSQMVEGIAPIIIENIPGLVNELLPPLLSAAGTIVQSLIQHLPTLLTTLIQAVIQYLPTLIQMLAQAVPTLISGITQMMIQIANMLTQPQFLQMMLQAGIQLLMELVIAIPQVVTSLANALPTIIDNIIAFLTDPATISMLLKGAVQLFMALVQAVPQILGALLGAFGSLVGSLWNWITSTFQGFAASFGDTISGAFRGAINGVLSFIEGFINGPINVINGFVDAINAAFGAIGVNIGHIPNVGLPRLARGGVVDSATAAVIGEAGQEAVLPLENNTGNWAGLLASTLAIEMEEQGNSGREINIYMTNEINSELDANEIGRIMTESIRRAV